MKLDTESCIVYQSGQPIDLTSVEYKLLRLFMEHPGRVFTKQQVYENVWGEEYAIADNNIMVCIRMVSPFPIPAKKYSICNVSESQGNKTASYHPPKSHSLMLTKTRIRRNLPTKKRFHSLCSIPILSPCVWLRTVSEQWAGTDMRGRIAMQTVHLNSRQTQIYIPSLSILTYSNKRFNRALICIDLLNMASRYSCCFSLDSA